MQGLESTRFDSKGRVN